MSRIAKGVPVNTAAQVNVIVTRPRADASALCAIARQLGHRAVPSPVIDIVDNETIPMLDGVSALAFTSANGVRAFAAKSDERQIPAFAVGPATAKALHDAGFSRVLAANGDVASLGELIRSDRQSADQGTSWSGAVLHIAGTHQAGDLVGTLKAHAVPAERAVLYEARATGKPSDEALSVIDHAMGQKGTQIVVTFFSQRSVQLFCTDLEQARGDHPFKFIVALCISAAVAETAQNAAPVAWQEIRTALAPNTDAMGQLLAQLSPKECG